MDFKVNVNIANKNIAKEFISHLMDDDVITINDNKLVWNDNNNTIVDTSKQDNGIELVSPIIKIDDIDIYRKLCIYLRDSGSEVNGKITVIDYEDKEKKYIHSYNFDKDEEFNFEKPLSKQDVAKKFEEEVDSQIDSFFESADTEEVQKDFLSLMQNSLRMYNYSPMNVFLVALEAENRGNTIEKIASFNKWSNIKTNGKLTIAQQGDKIIGTLKTKTDKEFELEINENKKQLWFNNIEYSFDEFTENKKLVSIDTDEENKPYESIASFMHKTMGEMVEDNLAEKDVTLKVSVLKGSKSYPIFVPIIKKAKRDEPVYETDEKGNLIRDIDGNPVPKLDEDGNPIYKTIQKSYLTGFTTGNVFDIKQTNAKELGVSQTVMEKYINMSKNDIVIDDDTYQNIIKKIENQYNIDIVEAEMRENDAGGVFYPQLNKIVINTAMCSDNSTKLSTLFHELGHALMHGFKTDEEYNNSHNKDTTQKEIEAETFSYLLSAQFGVNKRSDVYVHSFLRTIDKKERKQVLFGLINNIRDTAKKAMQELDLSKDVNQVIQYNKEVKNKLKNDKKIIFAKNI